MNLSFHAQQRLQQRGLSTSDLDLVLMHGTETSDGYYLRRSDVRRAERELRKLINQLNRLSGKYVIVDGDTVITTYHPGKKKQKRILRSRKPD